MPTIISSKSCCAIKLFTAGIQSEKLKFVFIRIHIGKIRSPIVKMKTKTRRRSRKTDKIWNKYCDNWKTKPTRNSNGQFLAQPHTGQILQFRMENGKKEKRKKKTISVWPLNDRYRECKRNWHTKCCRKMIESIVYYKSIGMNNENVVCVAIRSHI